MFPLRRAALRLALDCSFNVQATAIRRTITTAQSSTSLFRPIALDSRISHQFQRRWASDASAAETEDQATQDHSETAAEAVESAAEVSAEGSSEAISEVTSQTTEDPAVESATQAAEAAPYPQKQSKELLPPSKKLFVGNLLFDVTEEDLTSKFGRLEGFVGAKLVKFPNGMSKGFAFIEFSDTENAVAARDATQQTMYAGRVITVQYADDSRKVTQQRKNRGDVSPSKQLWVGNISHEMTEKDVTELLGGYKGIINIRMSYRPGTNISRGFCHAEFGEIEQAVEAREALNGQVIFGRTIVVDFAAPRLKREDLPSKY